MPTAPARPAREREDQAEDTHIAKTAVSSEARPKRVRAKAAVKVAPRQSAPQQGGERELDVAKVALVRARKTASPLLIGAGIGAAVALSVVALRSRDKRPTVALFASPNSTFFNAIVKTVAFAVAQSTAKGSLAGLVARAVGKAVA